MMPPMTQLYPLESIIIRKDILLNGMLFLHLFLELLAYFVRA